MPTELIYGDAMPIDVHVLWGAASEHVQIASVHEEGAKPAIIMVNEWLTAAGMPTIDYAELQSKLVGSQFEQSAASFTGWYATLHDRAKVNRLIAVLRRARDHSFGKDE